MLVTHNGMQHNIHKKADIQDIHNTQTHTHTHTHSHMRAYIVYIHMDVIKCKNKHTIDALYLPAILTQALSFLPHQS